MASAYDDPEEGTVKRRLQELTKANYNDPRVHSQPNRALSGYVYPPNGRESRFLGWNGSLRSKAHLENLDGVVVRRNRLGRFSYSADDLDAELELQRQSDFIKTYRESLRQIPDGYTPPIETSWHSVQICEYCKSPVYPSDQTRVGNSTWHKWCLKCHQCLRTLESASDVHLFRGIIHCIDCYNDLIISLNHHWLSPYNHPTSVYYNQLLQKYMEPHRDHDHEWRFWNETVKQRIGEYHDYENLNVIQREAARFSSFPEEENPIYENHEAIESFKFRSLKGLLENGKRFLKRPFRKPPPIQTFAKHLSEPKVRFLRNVEVETRDLPFHLTLEADEPIYENLASINNFRHRPLKSILKTSNGFVQKSSPRPPPLPTSFLNDARFHSVIHSRNNLNRFHRREMTDFRTMEPIYVNQETIDRYQSINRMSGPKVKRTFVKRPFRRMPPKPRFHNSLFQPKEKYWHGSNKGNGNEESFLEGVYRVKEPLYENQDAINQYKGNTFNKLIKRFIKRPIRPPAKPHTNGTINWRFRNGIDRQLDNYEDFDATFERQSVGTKDDIGDDSSVAYKSVLHSARNVWIEQIGAPLNQTPKHVKGSPFVDRNVRVPSYYEYRASHIIREEEVALRKIANIKQDYYGNLERLKSKVGLITNRQLERADLSPNVANKGVIQKTSMKQKTLKEKRNVKFSTEEQTIIFEPKNDSVKNGSKLINNKIKSKHKKENIYVNIDAVKKQVTPSVIKTSTPRRKRKDQLFQEVANSEEKRFETRLPVLVHFLVSSKNRFYQS